MTAPALRWLPAALLTLVVLSTPRPAESADRKLTASETARVLAGMPVDPEVVEAIGADRLGDFPERIDQHWKDFEERLGTPIRQWADPRVAFEEGDLVFYPFSGPDFATVHRLYPKADRYVLVAKQVGGRMPDLTDRETPLRDMLEVFDKATKRYGRSGFFKTKNLYARFDSHTAPIEGLTVMIAVMAEREGFEVTAVEPIRIGEDARIEAHPGERAEDDTWRSVRLKLKRRSDGEDVVVDYVYLDLSNKHLAKNDAGRKWLERVAKARVVFKAASHLPQFHTFSTVSEIVRDHALSIVQDETGLEFSQITPRFETKLFGSLPYISDGFSSEYQPDLRRAYGERDDIESLGFRFGYWKEGAFCLVLAQPRKAGSED